MFALLLVAACWFPPVNAPIADPFRAPACSYCPGNRGIEYATPFATPVRAVHAGVVTFAGTVAGTRYVVVDHGDGLRATYGKLATVSVGRGEMVGAGQHVGSTTSAFYFGLRRGEQYIDPSPFLGTLRRRPHLVPLDGARRRPGRPPSLECAATSVRHGGVERNRR